MKLNIKDKFNIELPSDPNKNNTRRQVHNACFSYVVPKKPTKPSIVHVSEEVANLIGLSKDDIQSDEFLSIFSGDKVLPNSNPYAMCYGGHQFGQWAGQLGDGRAINLAEVEHNNKKWALQLKGAGSTPYSRSADGLAVLRSSIREHLCSEAMFHLGIPTTRSLSLMLSGDMVMRDMLYNGNAELEKGAIVCRVAPSFIRFGNFQIFASRNEIEQLKQLADFTIKHFFPQIKATGKEAYLTFFNEVMQATIKMIVHWQRVGFVHGVMNTDNMSILGQTIDYGPYGWLEGFEPGWTPNTTDNQHKRYAYGNQPGIGLWNLVQLGNALYPLVEEVEPFQQIIDSYKSSFEKLNAEMMHTKLGLTKINENSIELINQLMKNLQLIETDMTLFFRQLSNFNKDTALTSNKDILEHIEDSFYDPESLNEEQLKQWKNWFSTYQNTLNEENQDTEKRKKLMDATNPKYVLRNYMAQLAIDAANEGDYSIIEELYQLLKNPYAEQSENEKWFAKRPEWARHKVGCSMLSCSS